MPEFFNFSGRVVGVCLQEWGHNGDVCPPYQLKRYKRLIMSIVGLVGEGTHINYGFDLFYDCSKLFLRTELPRDCC